MIIKDNRKNTIYKNYQKGGSNDIVKEAQYVINDAINTLDAYKIRINLLQSTILLNDLNMEEINIPLTKLENDINDINKIKNINKDKLEEINKKLVELETKIKDYTNIDEPINTILDKINIKIEKANKNNTNYIVTPVDSKNNIVYSFKELINTDELRDITKNIVNETITKIKDVTKIIIETNKTDEININTQIEELQKINNKNSNQITQINNITTKLKSLNNKFDDIFVINTLKLPADKPINNDLDLASQGDIFEDPTKLIGRDEQYDKIDDNELQIAGLTSYEYPNKFNIIDPETINTLLKGGAVKNTDINNVSKKITDEDLVSTLWAVNEPYRDELIKIYNTILKLKKVIIVLNRTVKEYNSKYIHMYHHINYITNYIKSSVIKKTYDYKYIGKGIVEYYLNLIKQINNDIKNKNNTGIFFYKYHYLNIKIVENFLNKLVTHNLWLWRDYVGNDRVSDNMTGQLNLNYTENAKIKNTIFIFNAFKTFLDEYQLVNAVPVAVYLRINTKNPNDTTDIFKINKTEWDSKYLQKCKSTSNETEIKHNIDNFKNVKFRRIFDQGEFKSNDILANYMALPNFLKKGKPIMFITYGYSGVGKTYTVFGKSGTSGILQSSLLALHNHVYYRTYELYGRAFPYKSYWDRNQNEYAHCINNFKYINNNVSHRQYVPKTTDGMTDFINDTQNSPISKNTTYTEITKENISKFSDIVDAIDLYRKDTLGTIKRTVNNVVSSRSIMVYDFKIKLDDDNYVDFVIMDLPGKENIYETFVETPNVKQYECIQVKPGICYNTNCNVDFNKMIKSMAYMNPMSLALNDKFVNLVTNDNINKYVKELSNPVFLGNGIDYDAKYTYTGTNKFLSESKNETEKNIDQVILNNLNVLELIKNIIDSNNFDLLNKLYKLIFTQLTNDTITKMRTADIEQPTEKCSIAEEQLMAPFEGYYINENITGLLSSILSNLFLPNIIKEQEELYMLLKDNKEIWNFPDIVPTEVKMQTYFFRSLLRKKFKLNGNTDFNKDTTYDVLFNNKKINKFKQWIEETYDYNKSYNKHNPPIDTIFKPYFKKIKNIYMFYVISNDKPENCDKQIKLISDSKDFLNMLDTFDKSIYDRLIEQLKIVNSDNIKKNSIIDNFKNYEFSQFYNLLNEADKKKLKEQIKNKQI